ncbi:Nucleotidylyl transferase superfamily protein [Perilla frutescens var. frutescens]|nr:Nucleotidylyl transferase superfamily protein [Perilla frutescens var. frutescens]
MEAKESSNNIEILPCKLLESISISPQPQLSLEAKFDIIRSIGEECIHEKELERLLANKHQIVCYDGFEPSGRMHIAQGVMKAINVNKLTSAGCKVKILIADVFAQMNNKMGGDMKKIQVLGKYLIEIWKSVGMNIGEGQVEFLWASKEINSRAHEYWPRVFDVAVRNTLSRILRCCQIMGRSEKDELSAAQIFYPCMQCADIFFLEADICQLGMDQRKVNMLAREYCDDIKRKNKPIILSHHMLPGFLEGQEKMSKSDPSSSIFMEDEELCNIMQPVRDHFMNNLEAKDLLERVKLSLKVFSKETEEINNSSETPPSHPLQTPSISPQLQLSLKERFNLIRSIGEECTQEDELESLLANKPHIICYDGFEPSGKMHIAEGIMKAINVNKLTSAGCKVKILIADSFAWLNNKMGRDMKKIRVIGEYMIEIWKAVGMNIGGGQVEFLWASEEIYSRDHEYFPLVMDIGMRNPLSRILRCYESMGLSEKDELSAAQIFYPCMQCADIIFHKVDICVMGMDQREVNMLAREYCDDNRRKNKPIILSHHMLPGIQEGQEKMSKSNSSFSIFMDEKEADVISKIKKAFCPPKVVEKNPCLEYIKYIIFPWFNEFMVARKPENGGDMTFKSFEDLVAHYESGELHPGDLKPSLSRAINQILQPVRDHFNSDPKAKELLKRVKADICQLDMLPGFLEGQEKMSKSDPSSSIFMEDEELCNIMQPVRDHFMNNLEAKDLLERVKLSLKVFSKETEEINNSSETPPSHPPQTPSISPQLQLSLKERFNLIRSIGEECTQEDELERLLANKPRIICYDGFEPSGRMHIAEVAESNSFLQKYGPIFRNCSTTSNASFWSLAPPAIPPRPICWAISAWSVSRKPRAKLGPFSRGGGS